MGFQTVVILPKVKGLEESGTPEVRRQPGPIVLPASHTLLQYLDADSAESAAQKIAQARGEPMVVYAPISVAQPQRGAMASSLTGSASSPPLSTKQT